MPKVARRSTGEAIRAGWRGFTEGMETMNRIEQSPRPSAYEIVADRPETVIETKHWIGTTLAKTTVKMSNDKPFQLPINAVKDKQILTHRGQKGQVIAYFLSTYRNGSWLETIEAITADGSYITFEIYGNHL